MTAFNGYHINQFNQKCKSLTGDGKCLMTYKEMRDLQAEMLDLLVALRTAESTILELKQANQAAEMISVELQGGTF